MANGKLITQESEVLNADQLADRLPTLPSEGVCNIEVEKHDTCSYSSILITDSVYEGLKKQDPHRNSIVKTSGKRRKVISEVLLKRYMRQTLYG